MRLQLIQRYQKRQRIGWVITHHGCTASSRNLTFTFLDMSVCMYPVTNKGSLCATIRTNMLRANPITHAHAHAGTGSEISLRRERRWVRGSPKVQVIQSSVGRLIACRITSAAVNEAASFGNAVEMAEWTCSSVDAAAPFPVTILSRRDALYTNPTRSAPLCSAPIGRTRPEARGSIQLDIENSVEYFY